MKNKRVKKSEGKSYFVRLENGEVHALNSFHICEMPLFCAGDALIHILHCKANLVRKVIIGLLGVGYPSPGVSPGVEADIVALATFPGISH